MSEVVPVTVREPKRKWGRTVALVLFAITVGGVVAALVVPRSRWPLEPAPRPAPTSKRR